MPKLRVGVAGLGRGRMFVDLFNGIDECEVVAVCDPLEKALQDYAGTVVIVIYRIWVKRSVPAMAGARLVVSDIGDILSPK